MISHDFLRKMLRVDRFGLVDAAAENECEEGFDAPPETEISFGE